MVIHACNPRLRQEDCLEFRSVWALGYTVSFKQAWTTEEAYKTKIQRSKNLKERKGCGGRQEREKKP